MLELQAFQQTFGAKAPLHILHVPLGTVNDGFMRRNTVKKFEKGPFRPVNSCLHSEFLLTLDKRCGDDDEMTLAKAKQVRVDRELYPEPAGRNLQMSVQTYFRLDIQRLFPPREVRLRAMSDCSQICSKQLTSREDRNFRNSHLWKVGSGS